MQWEGARPAPVWGMATHTVVANDGHLRFTMDATVSTTMDTTPVAAAASDDDDGNRQQLDVPSVLQSALEASRVGGGGGSNSPACCSCGDAPSATQLTAVDMARDGRMTGHGSQSPSKTPKMLLSCKPFHPTDGRTHGTLHQHSVAHRWITCSRLSLLFA
jgi:hypothetical protein